MARTFAGEPSARAPPAPPYFCVYVLLRGHSSGLEVPLRLFQLVVDELLDGVFLVFVYKLLDGRAHALLRQEGQLHGLPTHVRCRHKQVLRVCAFVCVCEGSTCSAASKYFLTKSSTLKPSMAVFLTSLL